MKNMNPKYKISRLKPKTKIPSSQYNSIITAMFKGHRQPKQQTERVGSLWFAKAGVALNDNGNKPTYFTCVAFALDFCTT